MKNKKTEDFSQGMPKEWEDELVKQLSDSIDKKIIDKLFNIGYKNIRRMKSIKKILKNL